MEEMCFCCPLCGGPLARQEHRAVCPQGHSFDVARQGYVHLLPVNKMHAKLPGDSREMVESRRRFLEAGYYESFRRLCAAWPRSALPSWGARPGRGCSSVTPAAGRATTPPGWGRPCPGPGVRVRYLQAGGKGRRGKAQGHPLCGGQLLCYPPGAGASTC